MGKSIRASALVLLLACSAQAGIIQNETPAPPPPSQPASTVNEPTDATVVEPTADGIVQNDAQSSLTQIALEMLAVLPSLF
jgi:hypothetical protein